MKRRRTSRQFRIFTVAMPAAMLLAAVVVLVAAIARAGSHQVRGVAVQSVSDSGVTLEWSRSGTQKADFYAVYYRSGKNEFSKAGEVPAASDPMFSVVDLEQAQGYDFYVTALRQKSSGPKPMSRRYKTVSAVTQPNPPAFAEVQRAEEGGVQIQFAQNPKADLIELQYVQGEIADFTNAETVELRDGVTDYLLTAVEANTPYQMRARARATVGRETLYGPWSAPYAYSGMRGVNLNGIDPNKPMIALTFDDGPGYNNASDRILDVLEQYGVTASFFMVGQNVLDHPENLKRKVALGCELGNHTMRHDHYGSKVTREDISDCSDAIYQVTGERPTAFRSPGGNTTALIREECAAEDMALYYWSVDTRDWKVRNADSVYNAVMNNASDGAIVLMHEIYGSTADAVERMVPELLERGYQLVTCSQLVAIKSGAVPVSGTQYLDGETVKNETS